MALDHVFLSRVQFGLTVTFHIIFPTMSIGLAMLLSVIEGLWLYTKDELYLRIYRFWLTIFAMGFGVGVVSGIVLSFEFGTNFATFSKVAGPVIGPLIGNEVLTAFFLEAGFLGIMLFGMEKVGPRIHFAATLLVALGTTISASWILAANSWMQTPAGVDWHDGHPVVTDWLAVVFNPSYLYRLPHMLLAAYITASLMMAGVGAWYLLKRQHLDFGRRTLSLGLGIATIFIGIQMSLGDALAVRMIQYQPAKFQAVEGYWDTTKRAPYLLAIGPDQAGQKNNFQWGIPYLGSLFITRSFDGAVPGLKETPRDRQPPMAPVFYGFRVMFLIGLTMFAVACMGLWLRWRQRLFVARWFHRLVLIMGPSGFFATVAGWYTSEIGRQPWVIYGVLHTADAASPLPARSVLTTTIVFAVVYSVFLVAFLVLAARHVARGPVEAPASPTYGGPIKRVLMTTAAAAVGATRRSAR